MRIGVRQLGAATRGWATLQRARLIRLRHPDAGEVSEFCFYARHLQFGDLAFDIGANRGAHTRQMLARGARVVAVEPQATLARELQARFPRATVVAAAVSDRAGEATLHTREGGELFASLSPDWRGNDGTMTTRQVVPVTTLGALIEEHGTPTFIKIDTEGFDHRVIRGLGVQVGQILFEVHAGDAAQAEEALRLLEALGPYEYRLEECGSWIFGKPMRPDQIVATVAEWDSHVWGNVYARHV
jgi:FkbM family methyltransferase